MIPEDNQSELDELKSAIGRACKGDIADVVAPESLRQRVTQLFAEQADKIVVESKFPRPLRMPFWKREIPGKRFALAASIGGLVICGSILLFSERWALAGPDMGTPAIVQAAVERHDQLLLSQNHSLNYADATTNQYQQLANDISKRSGLRIPNINLSGRGWELVGAKTWVSRGRVSVQFFYQRDAQTLSVLCVPDGASISDLKVWRVCGRVVAGHNLGPTGVIVVGHCPDGKLSTGEVDSIADLLTGN